MGLDACMQVRCKRAVTDDEVRKLRVDLVDAFGADSFVIIRCDESDRPAPIEMNVERAQHSIERHHDDSSTLEVNLSGRYYGIGYERGDLPNILAIARFLRDRTGGQVFYGGDSEAELSLLDDEVERKLWEHFIEHQHEPYQSGFTSFSSLDVVCSLCDTKMTNMGGGAGGRCAFFWCRGCGASIETRDGGQSFETHCLSSTYYGVSRFSIKVNGRQQWVKVVK